MSAWICIVNLVAGLLLASDNLVPPQPRLLRSLFQQMSPQSCSAGVYASVQSQDKATDSLMTYEVTYVSVFSPTVTWNGFLGSSLGIDCDDTLGLAVDREGNVLVASSSWYSWTWGAEPISSHVGLSDAFVAKLDKDGHPIWHTFLGSTNYDDHGYGIAVDDNGNVYVAGQGNSWGAPRIPYSDAEDGFVAKLDKDGKYQWHTYLGGVGQDRALGIDTDETGNIYVSGYSDGAGWGDNIKNPYQGHSDAFVAKLSNNGDMLWNTFLGSADYDQQSNGIVVRGSEVYVVGSSYLSWGYPKAPHSGAADAFVAKLSDSGESVWHTFLGSNGGDEGNSVALDAYGRIYVVGYSVSSWGIPRRPYSGSGTPDAFVAQLGPELGPQWREWQLAWNTFLGSGDWDKGKAVAAGGSSAFVTGYSNATWGNPVEPFTGDYDVFLAKVTNNGMLEWNTFLGSMDWDEGWAASTDESGGVCVAGCSGNTWGTTPIIPYTDGGDTFVAKVFVPKSTYLPLVMYNQFCDQYELNDTLPTAYPIESGQTINARICQGDIRDEYSFYVGSPTTVDFDLIITSTKADLDLYIRDQTGTVKCKSKNEGPGVDEYIRNCQITQKGTYYADVHPYDGTGEYSLQGSGW